MARFFFHFVHDGDWLSDSVGLELPDLRSAHDHAMVLVRQATSRFEDASDWRDWLIEITDARHRRLLTVLFPVVVRLGVRASPSIHALQRSATEVR